MLFRTHLAFGIFVWFILDLIIEMPFFVLIFVLLGVIVVDLDSSKARVAKIFWFFSFVFRHRGVMHSFFACFLFSSLLALVNLWAGFGVFVGWMSHLVLDVCTRMGVEVFWPFRWKVRGFIRSGGVVEDVLFVLLLLSDIGFVVYKFL